MPEHAPEYVELHTHSNFSFYEGASTIEELLARAQELGYPALALTDHDNLSGALRFARKAKRLDIKPITGVEISLDSESPGVKAGIDKGHASSGARRASGSRVLPLHLTLLAETPIGYRNLCNLLSLAATQSDRREPRLNVDLLATHADGIIALSGCGQGPIPQALTVGDWDTARTLAKQYLAWFGDRFYLETQQNLVRGDTQRQKALVALGRELGIPLVATNNSHYHIKNRHRLQDCLVAISHRKSLE